MAIKNKRKKRSNKLLIALLAVLIALAGGYTAYAYTADIWPFEEEVKDSSRNNSEKSKEDITDEPEREAAEGEEDVPEEEPTDKDAPPKKAPKQYEGEDPNTKDSLSGEINHLSANSNQLTVRNTIYQSVSSGTCTLKLTKGTTSVTKKSGIVQNPSSSSCEGFDVPMSELSGGTWKVKINVKSSDGKTLSLSDKIKI